MDLSRLLSPFRGTLGPGMLPVFLMFFFWGFGTGGLWLARPLVAYQVGGSFLLVALVSAASAAPRVIAGPVAGYLTDRFGRRPFIVLGAVLHIVALVGQFSSESYIGFLLLEVVGGTGIAVWMTSSSALLADSTEVETRGRVVALRASASRAGVLAGPVVGGIVASLLTLRHVFLFIALTKLIVIAITLLLIRERRRRPEPGVRPGVRLGALPRWRMPKVDLSMYRTRAFLALSIGAMAVGGVLGGTGAFRTLFPVQAAEGAGLGEVGIGNLIAIAGLLALAASFPAGMAADRIGRKRPLIFGLLGAALGVWLMADMSSFGTALLAVAVFGTAEAFATGTIMVYAMDLAPEDRRGAFLGAWQLSMNVGQMAGPLAIGAIADARGFPAAFATVAVALVVGAAMIAVLGTETRRARRYNDGAPRTRDGP